MDPNKKMMVEFLGQLEGGRWLVRLERKETQKDLAQFLLDKEWCVGVSDPPASFPLEKEEMVVGPQVPRGKVPLTGILSAGICFYINPAQFYICPSEDVSLYTEIRARCQASPPPGRVQPERPAETQSGHDVRLVGRQGGREGCELGPLQSGATAEGGRQCGDGHGGPGVHRGELPGPPAGEGQETQPLLCPPDIAEPGGWPHLYREP